MAIAEEFMVRRADLRGSSEARRAVAGDEGHAAVGSVEDFRMWPGSVMPPMLGCCMSVFPDRGSGSWGLVSFSRGRMPRLVGRSPVHGYAPACAPMQRWVRTSAPPYILLSRGRNLELMGLQTAGILRPL